jgi:hypothetical protein
MTMMSRLELLPRAGFARLRPITGTGKPRHFAGFPVRRTLFGPGGSLKAPALALGNDRMTGVLEVDIPTKLPLLCGVSLISMSLCHWYMYLTDMQRRNGMTATRPTLSFADRMSWAQIRGTYGNV